MRLIISVLGFVTLSVLNMGIAPGSAMLIEIQPIKYDGIIPNSFNLTCKPEVAEHCAAQIITIQVSKNGDSMVVWRPNAEIFYNPLLKSAILAEGNIDGNTGRGELTVAFSDVVKEDSGQYSCTMVYMDEWGYLQQEAAVKNYTVEKHDTQDIMKYLMAKLSAMESLVRQQQKQEENINKTVTELQNKLLSQEGQHTFLKDDQRKKEDDMKTTVTNLLIKSMDQERLIQQQNDSITRYEIRMSDAEQLLGEQRQVLQERARKDSMVSAFCSGYHNKDAIVKGQILIFTKILLNIGNHFNPSTGVYTVPWNGLYIFNLFVLTNYNGGQIDVDLKSNNEILATVRARDIDHTDQSSVSAIVSLKAGDQVRPITRELHKGNTVHPWNHYSTFSGYLLRPL